MKNSRYSWFIVVLFLSIFSFSAYASEDEDAEAVPKAPETMYVDLDPAIIVNLARKGSKLTYLKTEVQLAVKGEDKADQIRYHSAPIRHELVMLLSSKSKDELKSPEAREALRAQALEKINERLKLLDKDLKTEEVLFTTFIMQ